MKLPDLIFVGGKKLSGKDFLADTLVRGHGYTKVHIAEPWLRQQCRDMGIDFDLDYLPNKAQYREEIQRRATLARQEDPLCLVRVLPTVLQPLLERKLRVIVVGVRFINEANFAIMNGALVVKVEVDNFTRWNRFIHAGENLDHFDDPFEAEVDLMPYHLLLPGDLPYTVYLGAIADGYARLLEVRRQVAYGGFDDVAVRP